MGEFRMRESGIGNRESGIGKDRGVWQVWGVWGVWEVWGVWGDFY